MIILDTNVLSEMMKSRPLRSEAVFSWLRAIEPIAVYTTAICAAEILAGIGIMPEGRKRAEKLGTAEMVFGILLGNRVLPFDHDAARSYALVVASRRAHGKGTDPVDLQIAAIARANNMGIATRNVDDFEHCGVDLINPWEI